MRPRDAVDPWAELAAGNIAAAIWAALKRSFMSGATDAESYRIASEAGKAAARAEGRLSASAVMNAGREATAAELGDHIKGVYYTSVLDPNRCAKCREADDGILRQLGDPALTPVPNPLCEGWTKCRCMYFYVLKDEAPPHLLTYFDNTISLRAWNEAAHPRDPRTGRWIDTTPGLDPSLAEYIKAEGLGRAARPEQRDDRRARYDGSRRPFGSGYVEEGSPALADAALASADNLSANELQTMMHWQHYPRFSNQAPDWRQMAHIVTRGRLPHDMPLYRGVQTTPELEALGEGDHLDLPFIATTINRGGGEAYANDGDGGTLFVLEGKDGMPAAFPDATTDEWGDTEVVLGPRRWHVTRVTRGEADNPGVSAQMHIVHLSPGVDLDQDHDGVPDVLPAEPQHDAANVGGFDERAHRERLLRHLGEGDAGEDALPLIDHLHAHPRYLSPGRRPRMLYNVRFTIPGRQVVGLEGDILDELDRLMTRIEQPSSTSAESNAAANAVRDYAQLRSALIWLRMGSIHEGRGATAGSKGIRVQMPYDPAEALHRVMRKTSRGAAARDIERAFLDYADPGNDFRVRLAARRAARGGTPPSTATARPRVVGTPTHRGRDLLQGDGPIKITPDNVKAIWDGFGIQHPDGNLYLRVDRVSPGSHRIDVSGHVEDEDGRSWGSFTRYVQDIAPGQTPHVYNAGMSLSIGVQGRGLAQHMAERAERMYERMGMKQVRVSAGMDGGGYAWATQGFLFDTDPVECAAVARMKGEERLNHVWRSFLVGRYADDAQRARVYAKIEEAIRTAQSEADLARIGKDDPDMQFTADATAVRYHWASGEGQPIWPGKALMNGSSWDGIKPIGDGVGRPVPMPSVTERTEAALRTTEYGGDRAYISRRNRDVVLQRLEDAHLDLERDAVNNPDDPGNRRGYLMDQIRARQAQIREDLPDEALPSAADLNISEDARQYLIDMLDDGGGRGSANPAYSTAANYQVGLETNRSIPLSRRLRLIEAMYRLAYARDGVEDNLRRAERVRSYIDRLQGADKYDDDRLERLAQTFDRGTSLQQVIAEYLRGLKS